MNILNANLDDLKEIFRLYHLATEFQKVKFLGNLWPAFEKSVIESDIDEERLFKLMINETIACIWTITFSDAQIWEEKDNDQSIYIHRIATNPDFRGNNFVKIIVAWAKEFAVDHHKKWIRLDTCGRNDRLIEHYQNSGFTFLGINTLQDDSNLPQHYQNAEVCYFEITVA